MMTTLEDRIQNPEFNNWVKSALTLDFARDAVKEFVEKEIKINHKSLIQNISSTCSSCSFNTCSNCPKKETCENEELKRKIIKSHNTRKPSFDNTNPKDCWSQPWEFAKCFMPKSGDGKTKVADEPDFPSLIHVIVNNVNLREKAITLDDDKIFIKLSSGTLTITVKDIARVINAAIASLKTLSNEINDSILEISKLSQRCKQEIENEANKGINFLEIKVNDGVILIERKTKKGVEEVHDETKHGLEDIKKETTEATDQLIVKQKEGVDAIASKANEEASQLQYLCEENTVALQKTVETESEALKHKAHLVTEELKMKAKEENIAIKREKEKLIGIMKDGIQKIKTDIKLIQKTEKETEEVRDEISQTANEIQRTTDACVSTLQNVATACLESLYKETEIFGTFIRDSKSQSEPDKLNNFEYKLMELSGTMQEVQSRQNVATACLESLYKEMEIFGTLIRDSKSQSEPDKLNNFEYKLMELSGTMQEVQSRQRKVFPFDNLDIELKSENMCSITGMTKVSTDTLAVVDKINNRVKIINVRSNTIISIVDVDNPFDITCVNPHVLVVSCSEALQFLDVKDDKLTVGKKRLEFPNWCGGVDYTDVDKLFAVSFEDSQTIRIINMEGDTLRVIKLKQVVQGLPKQIYLMFSQDGRRIYVMNTMLNACSCFNSLDGTLIHSYEHAKLEGPRGIAVDSGDNVYIAGLQSTNIHLFSPDGSHVSIFLDKSNGIENPIAIAYCDQDNALYVSHSIYGKDVVSICPT